jgi:hypothetical protein
MINLHYSFHNDKYTTTPSMYYAPTLQGVMLMFLFLSYFKQLRTYII